MTVVFNVKEQYGIVGLMVDLEVVEWVPLASLDDRLHPFNKFLDDWVFTVVFEHLNQISQVK